MFYKITILAIFFIAVLSAPTERIFSDFETSFDTNSLNFIELQKPSCVSCNFAGTRVVQLISANDSWWNPCVPKNGTFPALPYSTVNPESAFMCNCPNCRFLLLNGGPQDRNSPAVYGAFLKYNGSYDVDITNGFQTSFTYWIQGDSISYKTAVQGIGFSFTMGFSSPFISASVNPFNYGLDVSGGSIGVVTAYNTANLGSSRNNNPSVSVRSFRNSLSIFPNTSLYSAPFNIANVERKNHLYEIYYDTMAPNGPFLTTYIDGTKIFTEVVDIRSVSQESEMTVNMGFTASTTETIISGHFLTNWRLRAFGDDNIFISCFGSHSIYRNGVLLGSGNNTKYEAASYPAILNVTDIIAFTATDPTGCIVEVRPRVGYPIDLDWTCSSSLVANWLQPDFVSNWPSAVVRGTNAINQPAGLRHLPNVGVDAKRIWNSALSQTTYCVAKIPRYCFNNSNPVISICANNSYCGPNNLCICNEGWMGINCDIQAPAELYYISPTNGTEEGNTTVSIIGNYFSRSDLCVVNGVVSSYVSFSFTEIKCRVPPKSGANNTISIGIDRGGNRSITFTYTYTIPIRILSFTPNQARLTDSISVTVFGTGFVPGMLCRFGPSFVPNTASFISSTQLLCLTVVVKQAIQTNIEVSANFVDWISNNSLSFSYYQEESSYCLGQYNSAGVARNLKDFNFVSVLNQFIPWNVASDRSTITTVPTINFTASTLTDLDMCCSSFSSGISDRTECGAFFNTSLFSSNNRTVTVQVNLRTVADVNEVITSWYNPCSDKPRRYDIFANNPNNIIATSSESSCISAPGAGFVVAICYNYFDIHTSQVFGIKFNNTIGSSNGLNFGAVGAHLFEIAVHGTFVDQPTSFELNSYSITVQVSDNPSPLNLDLFFRSPQGVLSGNIAFRETYTITATLYNEDGTPANEGILVGNKVVNISSNPTTEFNDLRIAATQKGKYYLIFDSGMYSTLNQNRRVNITVIPGLPKALESDNTSVVVKSGNTTVIPPLIICSLDTGGNPTNINQVSTTVTLSITSDVQINVQFTGTATRLTTSSPTCLSFNDIVLTRPLAGTYYFTFESPILQPRELIMQVIEGDPVSLSFYRQPDPVFFGGFMDPFPQIRALDAIGNFIGIRTSNIYQVSVSIIPVTQGAPSARVFNSTATFANSVAIFQYLNWYGQVGATYEMRFSIPTNPFVTPISVQVRIPPCNEQSRINTGPSLDGYSCVCIPGFGLNSLGLCSACSSGFFKRDAGDTPCLECSGSTTTYSPAQTQCACAKGFYDNSTDSSLICVDCPEGGNCDNGTVLGTAAGYWRPAEIPSSLNELKFYPCYIGNNPSEREKEAALEACPRNDTSITPRCGEGYTSTKCLVCDIGYGHSGPFCRECPKSANNWILLAVCGLILLAFLIFLVYQGRTPKNKESVSTRILLNHIQMLALLSAVGAAWTNPFQSLLAIGSAVSFLDTRIISLDCAFPFNYYDIFAFYIAIPWATILLMALFYVILWLIKGCIVPAVKKVAVEGKTLRSELLAQYILSCAVIIFIVYPAICIKVLEMFACFIEVGDKKYLNAAPDKQCFTDEYNFWVIFAWIMLFIFCLGAPLTALIIVWKFRKSENPHVNMVVRFFYDGYKDNRFFWEIVILLRKFLLVVVLTLADGLNNQIYGFMWIIQAALIAHIIFHPYVSGRQSRLELWSLVIITVTLCITLFLPTLPSSDVAAYALSFIVLILNVFIIVAFIFFIGRGLARRFTPKAWEKIVRAWFKCVPKKIAKQPPTLEGTINFFDTLASSNDYDRDMLLANLEKWWKQAPNYKHRRFVQELRKLSKGTSFSNFASRVMENRDSQMSVGSGSARSSIDLDARTSTTELPRVSRIM